MTVDTARWQIRVVEHADVDPTTLVGNPRNWRLHPRHQGDALTSALDRVGWVQSVIVNQRSGSLVDGHLRVALALQRGEPTIPVDYVDLDENEERLVLATLDPLGDLAGADDPALKALVSTFEGDLDQSLAKLLDDLTRSGKGLAAPALPTQEQIDERAGELAGQFAGPRASNMLDVICPSCGHEHTVNLDEVSK